MAIATSSKDRLTQAQEAEPARREQLLRAIVDEPSDASDDAATREKETALLKLGELYRDQKNADSLSTVVRDARTLPIAKARAAKLVQTLLGFFSVIPDGNATQIAMTKENADWARSEKRIFLAQSLEIRLVSLMIESNSLRDALAMINSLLRELKRLDDKMILTEVHLLESRVTHALANLPKAKAAQTSARTAANAIYCPPLLQSQLDMQSGVLLAEDKDYKTAFSYFFEALEGFSAQDDPRAVLALKYMLLCKVMTNLPEDVEALVSSKLALAYAGRDVDAMKVVATALKERSLAAFEAALVAYKKELSDDPIIRNHLAALYDTLLEQNLVRVIEPYSRVEIAYIAESVKQPTREVEAKLSQMILDKIFHGILDQGAGSLIVFDEPEDDATYLSTLATLSTVGRTVDNLHARVRAMT